MQQHAAYQRSASQVRDFWHRHALHLQQNNPPSSFKHDFVCDMQALDADITAGSHEAVMHRRVRDILWKQRAFLIQFEFCLDEFNKYLAALRLVDGLE
jgi:hypothetical protein